MDRFSMGLACVALGVVGCGKTDDSGDAEGPEGSVLSGDASKPLADLTDDEVVEVCEGIADLYDDEQAYVRGICIVGAIENSDDVESCDADVEACVADLSIEPLSLDECTESLDFAGCDAPVSELNDCIADQHKSVQRVSELRSCGDAERKGVSEDWLDEVPACRRLVDHCPEAFDDPPNETDEVDEIDEVDETDGGTTVPDTHSIEGNLEGEPVDIRPDGGLSSGHTARSGYWTSTLEFGGAALWLWGETDVGQGLLKMPPSGPEASKWLCLDGVEVTRDAAAGTAAWESNGLSVLSECDASDPEPLELTFVIGEDVTGTLRGEPVSWISSGFECLGSSCNLTFDEADAAFVGQAPWILELDAALEPGVSTPFERATLIHPSGAGAVACGGGGFVEWAATPGTDDTFHVQVDGIGPLAECPGTPIEGDLSGKF